MEHPAIAAASRPPLTEVALCALVGRAFPGDKFAYHQGFLAIDAGADSDLPAAERKRLHRIAARALQLSEQGLVHLLQRRDGPGEYSYFIVVRRRPRGAGGALQVVIEQASLSALRRSA